MGRKKPITKTVLVPTDEALLEKLSDASGAVSRAELLGRDLEAAKAAFEAVQDEVRETGLEFELQGIGRKRYELLLREHAPTDEQKAKEPNAAWNVDTFPPALLALTCTNVDMDEEGWRAEVFESDDWGTGELRMLLDAALEVNTKRRVVELGN